jgi:hypothetical protein
MADRSDRLGRLSDTGRAQRFEVAELDGLRISRLLARRRPPEESA